MNLIKKLIFIGFFTIRCNTWGDVVHGKERMELTSETKNFLKVTNFKGYSEEDILSKFGKKFRDRLTFDPPLHKELFGEEYEVRRIISYGYTKGVGEEYSSFRTAFNKESIVITFFTDLVTVKEYVIFHEQYDEIDKISKVGGLDKYPSSNEAKSRYFWPDATCDFIFYERKVKKIIYGNKVWRKKHWENRRCYWETNQDFAERNFGNIDYN